MSEAENRSRAARRAIAAIELEAKLLDLTDVFRPATTKSRELGGSSKLKDIVESPRAL